jgi:Sec-independent protein translocase protein TatA
MRNLIVVFGTEKVIVITRGVIVVVVVRIMKWSVIVLVIVILLGAERCSLFGGKSETTKTKHVLMPTIVTR